MSSPAYHLGSVLENRLGLQIGRILGKYAVRSVRPRTVAPQASGYIAALDQDGVVVIPDFLPAAELRKLETEYETLRSQMQFKQFRERYGRLSVARMMLSQHRELAPEFNRLLGENQLIRSLAAAVAHVTRPSAPTLELTIYLLDNPDAPDNDDENLLHADLHTPTLKCFYYLNDVDAENGAFVYAKGSSRMSVARLRYEYDLSVRTARLKRGDRNVDGVAERFGTARAIMTEAQRRELGIVETQVEVKANTLVAANNVGFHRRGEFTSRRERASVVINFRHLQKPFLS